MNFISLCSGIEAASVAFGPLGWKAIAFSEIEGFPSAVLAHHYPTVRNYGDMSLFRDWPDELFADADAIVGGPPCQAFSVAGLRKSLDDERGNLSLTFCEIADAIDHVRGMRGQPPSIIFWENVPGVLSTRDNAFGCFLGELAGESGPLEPAGRRWTDAGCVYGPARAVAWRVLDAQYFGLAQRRRRVFVVASARKGFDPATVLFEWDGMRRDTAPGRQARQDVANTIAGGARNRGGYSTDDIPMTPDVAQCLTTGTGQRYDPETETILPVAHTLRGEGFDASEDGTGRGTPLVPVAFAENSRSEIRLEGGDGQRTGALSTGGGKPGQGVPMIAFPANLSGTQCASEDGSTHALGCGSTGGQASVAVAVSLRGREGGATAELGDEVQNCLRASGGGGDKAYVLAPAADTLDNKGIVTLKEGNASTQETDPGTLLRTLRQEVGEEAFAKWGLGILDSLQQAEVLRQALHGLSIRPAPFSRSWVVYCALSRSENRSVWLLQSLREAGCERCASQGWEPSEQLAGELGAYLSELSRPGAQAARFLHDLWQASQGLGVLRQALSAVQEVGRPAHGQRKPVHAGAEGFGAAGAEGLQGAGLHREIPRDGVLQQACSASEAGNSGCSATEQERGGQSRLGQTPFAVRRLTCEEAEFLQGFPRGYSKIPWRKKPADQCPDGPRYRALGNSWAVPVARWVGRRINDALAAAKP